ncbi:MAG: RIP metalloprotease RseP [Acidobacteria bacterium]|nr:MAG: RIP metalloprotease RseP [Acidobacteriota bacterium]
MGFFSIPYLGNIVAMAIMLGILILIHETGHFLMAKLFKVNVKVFSIGFGKKLFSIKKGETEYQFSLIPLGGYVAMLGENPEDAEVEEPGNFNLKPRWQRFIILLMGAAFNIILAFFLLTAINMVQRAEPLWHSSTPVVGAIDPSSPAFVANLKTGDRVISFDGIRVKSWSALQLLVATNPNHEAKLVVDRDGRLLTLPVKLISKGRDDAGFLGVFPYRPVHIQALLKNSPSEKAGLKKGDEILSVNGKPIISGIEQCQSTIEKTPGKTIELVVNRSGRKIPITVTPIGEPGKHKIGVYLEEPYRLIKLGFGKALIQSGKDISRITALTFSVLGKLVTGHLSIRSISGPVDIARLSGQAARSGTLSFLYLMAMISLQLGIFNLLPIPMLDGGHITILTLEAVRRRDFSFNLKEKITSVGFFLLVALMVIVVISDVLKNLNIGW